MEASVGCGELSGFPPGCASRSRPTCRAGLRTYPLSGRLYVKLGYSQLRDDKYEKAARSFGYAVRLGTDVRDNVVIARVGLGAIGLFNLKSNDAVEELKKALDADADNTAALNLLGEIYYVPVPTGRSVSR